MRKVDNRSGGSADRDPILSIIERSENLTAEEKDCAVELLDVYLEDPLQQEYFFIAATDATDRPIGFVCYGETPLTDAVYDLYWIVVDPEYRRRGVASRLLVQTEEILRGLGRGEGAEGQGGRGASGARLLVAETSGGAGYAPAHGLYLKNGFNEEARIKSFYKPGDDLVIFVKRLEKTD
jgi:ribosomal protein S18 acetylase RimI-like enzyme